MLKSFTFMLVLVSCGADDSGGGGPTGPSPTPYKSTTIEDKHGANTPQTDAPAVTVSPSSSPIASNKPSPMPTPTPIALEMINQQPFETNDWAYDFRGVPLSYGTDQFQRQILTWKKTPSGTLDCWVRVVIQIPASHDWATVTFSQISGSQVAGCWDSGQTIRYAWLKVGVCQGYHQQTYICGTTGIAYDLISLY